MAIGSVNGGDALKKVFHGIMLKHRMNAVS